MPLEPIFKKGVQGASPWRGLGQRPNLNLFSETQMTNEMTGGEAIACMLQAHHGGAMFGMGGFQLLPFYDAARRLGLPHHLINDERAAIFIADAYAKVSGRVGLC